MTSSSLQIDHIFVFVEAGPIDSGSNQDPMEARWLKEAGFIESYRRDHPGQGTTNICYCFDNTYLELLWITDEAAAKSDLISKTRLAERSLWQENGASPFGIALRPELPFETWNYNPPYLPKGLSIPVANSSLDPAQPFIFTSPSGKRPDVWQRDPEIKRQRSCGFSEIRQVELNMPVNNQPSADLFNLNQIGLISLIQSGTHHTMRLSLSNSEGTITHDLLLPTCEIIPADKSH